MNLRKLKSLLVENGISQKELAKNLGLTPQGLNRKLNGKSTFTIVEADKISIILKIKEPNKIFFTQT